jgi:hypothetical protein
MRYNPSYIVGSERGSDLALIWEGIGTEFGLRISASGRAKLYYIDEDNIYTEYAYDLMQLDMWVDIFNREENLLTRTNV